jgi:type III secretory pathway component EscU
MASASVTIKLDPTDFALIMRCLEIVRDDMGDAAKNTERDPKLRNDARQLATEIDNLMRQLR